MNRSNYTTVRKEKGKTLLSIALATLRLALTWWS